MMIMERPLADCLQDDLTRFGLAHFPHQALPKQFFYGDDEDVEDDGLGYYSDGVKRTLTDEQVAIFRNSEIQQEMKFRRKRYEKNKKRNQKRTEEREKAAQAMISTYAATKSFDSHNNHGDFWELTEAAEVEKAPVDLVSNTNKLDETKSANPPTTPSDVGSASLPRHHRQKVARLKRAAKKERKKNRKDERAAQANESEEFTPRRIARELDDQTGQDIELEY